MSDPTWTTDKPTVKGRYAYLQLRGVRFGDVRRIIAHEDGTLWVDFGCAGELLLAQCEDGLWLGPLPDVPEELARGA